MSTTEDLVPILKRLKISGILETLHLRTRQAVEDNLAHEEFLYRVLHDELERREGKQLQVRLRRASFDGDKTLEDFNFLFNPSIPKSKIIDIGTCNFINRQENILFVGPSGVGKSHIAQAIGHRACRLGRNVLNIQSHKLLGDLRSGRADGSSARKLAKYSKIEVLIIDDLGLYPFKEDEATDFYELIRLRYEKHSTVITSNRDVSEWYPLFGDDLLASAAMDRLLHHSQIIVMEGNSYRNPPRKKRAKAA